MLTLADMLNAREQRAKRREEMQGVCGGTLLSLTVNMPGQEKDSRRVRKLFQKASVRLAEKFTVRESRVLYDKTGPHGLFSVEEDARSAKKAACRLEEEASWSRLWDIDVYDGQGGIMADTAREGGRLCLLCERPAFACMRDNRHNASELAEKIEELFADFFAAESRDISPKAAIFASLATEAALYEAACGPKPGLVDPFGSGSHKDMDFFTFQRSTAALAHFFARFAEAGLRHEEEPALLLPVLRKIGLEAEEAMFTATGGVNTQKGLVFSLGLLLGASGILAYRGENISAENLSHCVQQLAFGLSEKELGSAKDACTAGEAAYKEFAVAGVRGEAEKGFPSVLEAGLPVLKTALLAGNDLNKSLLITLLALMAQVDDTTVLSRGAGMDALEWVKETAAEFTAKGYLQQNEWREKMAILGSKFTQRGLSPGGSADLLAIAWYMHRIVGLSF